MRIFHYDASEKGKQADIPARGEIKNVAREIVERGAIFLPLSS